jgi:DNA gyrase subunit A
MGLRDIKTTPRNGPVIGIARVRDGDELLMMTARGKIQRIAVGEISVIGRNTSGVRIMGLDESDTLAGIVRVPQEEADEDDAASEAALGEAALQMPIAPADSAPTDSATGDASATSPEDDEEGDDG